MTNSKLKWKVEYKDGTVAYEDEVNYKELNRPEVAKFQIIARDGGEVVYSTNVFDEDKFAYRRRTFMEGNGSKIEVCHLVLRFTPTGNKFAFIFDSSSKIIARDSFSDNSKWMYPPTFAPFEGF